MGGPAVVTGRGGGGDGGGGGGGGGGETLTAGTCLRPSANALRTAICSRSRCSADTVRCISRLSAAATSSGDIAIIWANSKADRGPGRKPPPPQLPPPSPPLPAMRQSPDLWASLVDDSSTMSGADYDFLDSFRFDTPPVSPQSPSQQARPYRPTSVRSPSSAEGAAKKMPRAKAI